MATLPPAVLEDVKNKQTVLFIGAGFSISAGFPSSQAIAALLAAKLPRGRSVDPPQLDQAAGRFEATYGRSRLVSEVETFLKTAPEPPLSASHQLLASLVKHGFIRTIVTTNYDTLIEDACALIGAPITVVAHESQLHAAGADSPVLYKIHGDFFHPELLVLTQKDLAEWLSRPEIQQVVDQLKAIFSRQALLFLGYSLTDFDILSVLLRADPSTRGAPRSNRFAALYSDDDMQEAAYRLRQYQVEAFHCPDIEQLLRTVILELPIRLNVKHLVFNYPSWYPDQQARYGGIETFIRFLRQNSTDVDHEEVPVYNGRMLISTPDYLAYTQRPAYPASFFFFRAAAKAALCNLLRERSRRHGNVPDVIHVHFLEFAPMCEESGLPTLCTSHSLLSLDLAFTKGLFDERAAPGAKEEVVAAYAAEKAAASAARFVTVISKSHEQQVRDLGARSILRLEAPFDAGAFTLEPAPGAARQRVYLPERFTITYLGRPDRRKGIEVLIQACERLVGQYKDFQLLFVGYGFNHAPGVLGFGAGRFSFDTSMLESQGVGVQIRNSDAEHVGVYYSASDLIVVPSLYEPMGYVVLEAMACGRPVVAARTGGIIETVEDNINGILFDPANADDLAKKLIALIADPDTRQRLGQQARRHVEARRPAKEIVRDWEQLYRQAAFAFGDSLYPARDLLATIRKQCEDIAELFKDLARHSPVEVYDAAQRGCAVARRVMDEKEKQWPLPKGVPVNAALLRAIAVELERALRRRGVAVEFSPVSLFEVMNDLALAVLNREPDQLPTQPRAELTRKQLQQPWFEKVVGDDPAPRGAAAP
jgi:glycosyltransferase involved in cell wall biosynthesis